MSLLDEDSEYKVDPVAAMEATSRAVAVMTTLIVSRGAAFDIIAATADEEDGDRVLLSGLVNLCNVMVGSLAHEWKITHEQVLQKLVLNMHRIIEKGGS